MFSPPVSHLNLFSCNTTAQQQAAWGSQFSILHTVATNSTYRSMHAHTQSYSCRDCSPSAVLLLCFLCLSEIKPVNLLVFQLQLHSAFSPLPLLFVSVFPVKTRSFSNPQLPLSVTSRYTRIPWQPHVHPRHPVQTASSFPAPSCRLCSLSMAGSADTALFSTLQTVRRETFFTSF